MSTLAWIIATSLLMGAIAAIGAFTLLWKESTLQKILTPLVAFAAGSLLGGAFFHMIPEGLQKNPSHNLFFLWVLLGFTAFFALEKFLRWHHCHEAQGDCKQPVTYLILIGDGVHNFVAGSAVAGTFLVDIRLGITAWLAAAAHEVPQELGDFGVLVHGGWNKTKALFLNVLSALTFLLGGLLAYMASFRFDVSFLLPFAAGNFIYIGASDLVPRINKPVSLAQNALHFVFFAGGIVLLLVVRAVLPGE